MATLQKSGISADPYLIKVGDYVSDKAYKAACNLLEMREQDRPTAIFAFNDLGAINVYRAARQHGISLPEQLSIIGFDDVYPAASMCPSLTTIRQPFGLIARQCIDLILEAREGGGGGTELLHSSHAACRTRKLRIASTSVTQQRNTESASTKHPCI